MPDQIDTHEIDGLLKLAPDFWGKPRMAALLTGYLSEVQALEEGIFTFLNGIDVDTCGRFALIGLVKIVGEPSRPETEQLRALVKGRVIANKSSGTPADIVLVVEALTGSPGTLLEEDLAVRVLTVAAPAPAAAAQVLDDACSADVSTAWLEAGTFALPDHADPSPPITGAMGTGTWSARYEP